ncbi:macrolide-inactivating glycosyltransferase [Streptomyces sp. LX-29]|uniref:macrolide-inactivating glycosyltransferase n=1 Tax=Streptomyces sp. LX-29 TaxID=2900152 RepID=UPI00240D9E19|nr:macrolide-inactivating glycosyltransferase [Streptomyces sp. LX-29]WFB06895.1 macrolide-inactivating glycosyltransferase [Streptomyces sp. LX-29]
MSHIAMFSIAAHGHVNPSLEVIRELVARGHRVTYAIPESFAEKVAATGAEPRVFGSVLPTADEPEAWGTELIEHIEPFLADAIQALPQHAAAYAGDEPDLVLWDITAWPAPVLARRWGVPAIQLSPNLVAWEGYEEEVAEPMYAELKASERGQAYYARFRAWLDANGLADTDPDRMLGRPDRCVVLIPRALQPHADRVDETVYTFVGACQGARDETEWRRPAAAARDKVLLISLGSTWTREPDLYRACVAAFGGLPGWHVVLQIGAHVDLAGLGEIPDNIEVHRWVPQLSILRQADAFITHAGAGGSQEGLACGVPMVAVPQAVDQFGNADVLQSLGVARHLPKEEATAEALREAVLALVSDPEVAKRCAEVRRQVEAEGGTRQAADLIEAALPA